MNNSEKTRERWMVLAELAAKEQDPNKLIALVTEINELLAEEQTPSNFSLPPTSRQAKAGIVAERGRENESGI